MSDRPNRDVISNIWDVGPDDGVVTIRDRFSKPGRRQPRLSDEVAAHRIAAADELASSIGKRIGVWCCLASAAIIIATIWALGRLCGSW